MTHTRHPLTYEKNDYSGDNWLVGSVDFGADGYYTITTDHVHASELHLGEPEHDVRLWCHAHELLTACKLALAEMEQRYTDFDFDAWAKSWGKGKRHPAERAIKAMRYAITHAEGGEQQEAKHGNA